ncbi:MAG: SRPBCC family protein [Calditrichaeota bacterium]|nr:MAG: SRPBCC family protein [Calditrichota bacterium]
MTEITRSIEVAADVEKVWSCLHPRNWPKVFSSVKEVNGYKNGEQGVGTQARVVAGDKETAIRYNVEVVEFVEKSRIVYRRYGGPLAGKGIIKLRPLQSGTLVTRTGYYDDELSEETIRALSEGMETDNRRIKKLIESA